MRVALRFVSFLSSDSTTVNSTHDTTVPMHIYAYCTYKHMLMLFFFGKFFSMSVIDASLIYDIDENRQSRESKQEAKI